MNNLAHIKLVMILIASAAVVGCNASKKPITGATIEDNIKGWADKVGIGVTFKHGSGYQSNPAGYGQQSMPSSYRSTQRAYPDGRIQYSIDDVRKNFPGCSVEMASSERPMAIVQGNCNGRAFAYTPEHKESDCGVLLDLDPATLFDCMVDNQFMTKYNPGYDNNLSKVNGAASSRGVTSIAPNNTRKSSAHSNSNQTLIGGCSTDYLDPIAIKQGCLRTLNFSSANSQNEIDSAVDSCVRGQLNYRQMVLQRETAELEENTRKQEEYKKWSESAAYKAQVEYAYSILSNGNAATSGGASGNEDCISQCENDCLSSSGVSNMIDKDGMPYFDNSGSLGPCKATCGMKCQ